MRSSISRVCFSAIFCSLLIAPLARAQAADSASDPGYVAGDAKFMTGMIGHHAQAVLISGWAPTHGASPSIIRLTERIVVGQQDEIQLMETWLQDRGEPVPDPSSHANHAGMDHSMHMPGMLNAAQLDSLDNARGPEFDRLFLTYMIQHHKGAIVMVNELFATHGAGQDEPTFRLASNIYADQTTEIARMQKMLAALDAEGTSP
ncbi:MAG: DUF305 domain-containing protein [Gemmatimonadota bacterium]|nr:DUF305 domain-containing protein [Gemmatimonadota bacterium]MDH5255873.1 DUF305 domain-containing protein [Gammaproteobacteria bacterium]